MFGINSPRILDMRMDRCRLFKPRRHKSRKTLPPLRDMLDHSSKRKPYGRRLRRTVIYCPRHWFVGHPDWPEITREFARGLLSVKPHPP